MSRIGDAVIAEQERIGQTYSAAEIEGWMMDSCKLDHAMKALRRIANGEGREASRVIPGAGPFDGSVVIAMRAIAGIEDDGKPPVDPETIKGHDYATEREYRLHVLETTQPQAEDGACPW